MDVPAASLVKLCTVLYKFIERGEAGDMDVPAVSLVKLCTVLYKFIERGQETWMCPQLA